MKINQIIINEDKQRLDPSCWTGYHKAGTKMKGGTRVNNCVPNESINEFAPPEGDDGPNEDEILFKLAQKWWLGSEQDMIRAERALASMGWEIGEDEGSYDNGGVFVVRAGDEHGKSYQSWPHEELIDEGQTSDMRNFFSTQQPLNPAPIQSPTTGPVIATVTRPSESVKESMPASVIKNKQRNASMSDKEFYQAHKDKSEDELKGMAHRHGYGKGSTHYVDKCKKGQQELEEGENWSKHNNPRAGGMSQKSVKSYRRSHPGSKIQTAVTTKPSKLKKGSKSAKRRASFCARMRGMKKHRTGAKTARDPNSNINKSLRRWHCESVEELQQLLMIAEQKINEAKNWKQQAAIAIAKKNEVNEGKPEEKEADYGDDYQDMVKRVGQKAKQQELAKKKKEEKPKELDESTEQLNKIIKLSGYKK
jgi:hypothetical protein